MGIEQTGNGGSKSPVVIIIGLILLGLALYFGSR